MQVKLMEDILPILKKVAYLLCSSWTWSPQSFSIYEVSTMQPVVRFNYSAMVHGLIEDRKTNLIIKYCPIEDLRVREVVPPLESEKRQFDQMYQKKAMKKDQEMKLHIHKLYFDN